MEYRKKCVICKQDFITHKSNKEVCSIDCRKAANRLFSLRFMRQRRRDERMVWKVCSRCKSNFQSMYSKKEVHCITCQLGSFRKNLPPAVPYATDKDGIVITTALPVTEDIVL